MQEKGPRALLGSVTAAGAGGRAPPLEEGLALRGSTTAAGGGSHAPPLLEVVIVPNRC